jgi:serine/threonine-protein kinase HipA
MTAEALGISVPQSFIINTGSAKDEEILFATKRYDRIMDGAGNTISCLL